MAFSLLSSQVKCVALLYVGPLVFTYVNNLKTVLVGFVIIELPMKT